MSVALQGILLNAVFKSMQSFKETSFCSANQVNIFAAVAVFFISLVPQFRDFQRELYVVLFARRVVDLDDDSYRVKYTAGGGNLVIPWLVLIVEAAVFIGVTFTGFYVIVVQDDIVELVGACLAIGFINDIDNMAFDAFIGSFIKERFQRKKYELLPIMSENLRRDQSNHLTQRKFVEFWHFFGAILVAVVAFVTITGVSFTACDSGANNSTSIVGV